MGVDKGYIKYIDNIHIVQTIYTTATNRVNKVVSLHSLIILTGANGFVTPEIQIKITIKKEKEINLKILF